MTAAELTGLEGVYEQGTNLHHALVLAARHLRRHPNAQPVVLVVTDGEPTAHLEDFRDGHGAPVFFDYPPHPRTIAQTVREFDEVARLGAQVTFFRLGSDPGLARFVDQMARRVGRPGRGARSRRPRRRSGRRLPVVPPPQVELPSRPRNNLRHIRFSCHTIGNSVGGSN